MRRTAVHSIKHYLPPVGIKAPPLSFATEANGLLFVSGIPGFTQEGTLQPNFAEQFDRVVVNIRDILQQAGCEFKDILKLTVFLTRASDVEEMNRLYGPAFGPAPYPARTTLVVQALPSPEMLLEAECIVLLPAK
jgi:2-iminobutanoate/2-iminopropanoate deaminase